ncbi:pyruvate, phosphate dikinase PpdK [Mycobacterium tuberculosis]|nr:pyruvate, phosphate dikinase PpdK [Mycobacterium tuberculosis]
MVPAHHVDAVAFVAQDLAWVVRAAVQRHNGVFESSVGATIGSGDTSHGHPLMLLMGNARPPTVGPQGRLGQRSDYSACVWCWALPMLRDNAGCR